MATEYHLQEVPDDDVVRANLLRSELSLFRDDLLDLAGNIGTRTRRSDPVVNDNLNWIVRRFDEMQQRLHRAEYDVR